MKFKNKNKNTSCVAQIYYVAMYYSVFLDDESFICQDFPLTFQLTCESANERTTHNCVSHTCNEVSMNGNVTFTNTYTHKRYQLHNYSGTQTGGKSIKCVNSRARAKNDTKEKGQLAFIIHISLSLPANVQLP